MAETLMSSALRLYEQLTEAKDDKTRARLFDMPARCGYQKVKAVRAGGGSEMPDFKASALASRMLDYKT